MLNDIAALRSVLRFIVSGMATTGDTACVLQYRQGRHGTDAVIDCARCEGPSSLSDPVCRRRVVKALSGKAWMDRLQLEKNIVREYSGGGLASLLSLVSVYDDMRLYASDFPSFGCGQCDGPRKRAIDGAKEETLARPADCYGIISSIPILPGSAGISECRECMERYSIFVDDMARLSRRVNSVPATPYVRPRFSSSKIKMEPPDRSVFIRSYETGGGPFAPPLHVTVYELAESLEKMYYIVPWEYTMDEAEIALLVEAKQRLLSKRPETTEFMDAENMRPLFYRYGKESLSAAAGARGMRLGMARLERLASALVKYTCGLGILEDVLTDPHIEDAYVNAPVGLSPLHVVVDGEECTSNVFLSEADVESMISRLRAISGRPFSEASPVLDMDLGEFHTRVSAIGTPLSRGLAYAFRRHKKTPWTLPQLVSRGMLTSYAAGLLSVLVDGQSSILVTGSRGAGKTSLLGAMMLEISQSCRMLAIEDTRELPIEDMQRCGWKVQGMGTRASISGSEAEFQAQDVLRAALRLGESALIIGEVRGAEARALYEAMRIGASGNSVMGTIHGASCRDVYERVVHDIGVPPASFKATDAVVVCSTVRAGGSHIRERKVIQVAEISRSRWDDVDGTFEDILRYEAASGSLEATDRIDTGRSEVLQGIAKKWGLTIKAINSEVNARAALMDKTSCAPMAMEAAGYARCVNVYRVMCDKSRMAHGKIDHGEVMKAWERWFREGGINGI